MTQRTQGILFASTTAILWGFLSIILKYSLLFTDSLTIVFFRFAVAGIFLFSFLLVLKSFSLKEFISQARLTILAGFCLAGNYFGYMKGVELTSPSNAQVVIQLAPVLLVLTGIIFFKEKLTSRQKIGGLIVLIGLSLFNWDQVQNLKSDKNTFYIGTYWVLFGAVTWVLWASLHKIAVRSKNPQIINLGVYIVASLFFTPMVNFSKLANLSFWQWSVLTFLGFNTVVAYGCMAEAMKRLPINQVSFIITLNPILTLISVEVFIATGASWLGGRNTSIVGFLGASLLLFGVYRVVVKKPDL